MVNGIQVTGRKVSKKNSRRCWVHVPATLKRLLGNRPERSLGNVTEGLLGNMKDRLLRNMRNYVARKHGAA